MTTGELIEDAPKALLKAKELEEEVAKSLSDDQLVEEAR